MREVRRILRAPDFAPASTPALKWAIAMAKANRARLTVVHVMAPPALALPGEGYVSPTLYESLESSPRAAAQKRLKVVVARARAAGVPASVLLLEGVPYELITRAARNADLLVIGTHGRSALAKLFPGSVASRLLASRPSPLPTGR